MHVIGTAGHVDHGKSTLIKALTGIDPDRLKEEKERQMTIDLGFAWLRLPSNKEIGIVDVPGHKDFIDNMLVGAGGVDAVLMVIAADEGVMPQTREHLSILDLLNIQAGIIVITKIDVIQDHAWLELIETEIKEQMAGTFLEAAPIVKVSAETGEGLPELISEIDALLLKLSGKMQKGTPRLPVDRVFSITGFGTVVTGTLLDGNLENGQKVCIMPKNISSRIRGIQSHRKKIQKVEPGNRTAINLVGVDVEQIGRGDVITLPDSFKPTQRVDVYVETICDLPGMIKHNDPMKCFLGTKQTNARIRVIGQNAFKPGQEGFAQMEFEEEVIAEKLDRFILRRHSPPTTIGGGFILNVHPKNRYKRFAPQVIQRFKALKEGSKYDDLLLRIKEDGILNWEELVQIGKLNGFNESALKIIVTEDLEDEIVILQKNDGEMKNEDAIFSFEKWKIIQNQILQHLERFHARHPHLYGIKESDLLKAIRLEFQVLRAVLKQMESDREIESCGDLIKLVEHTAEFSSTQKNAIEELSQLMKANGINSPSVEECKSIVGEEVYGTLLVFGDLVEVTDTIVFRKKDLDGFIAEVKRMFGQKADLTLGEFRDQFHTSRKYALAVLEYMDREKITRRESDHRVLIKI